MVVKGEKYLKRQQSFYLFLLISAYISTFGFGIFYYSTGVKELYLPVFGAFTLYVIFGIVSFFRKERLVTLFRLSVSLAAISFYIQCLYTGGINSSAVLEFVIPPILAFFYRPVIDRYIFMGLSLVAFISFLPLSEMGIAVDLLPAEVQNAHSFLCGIFVFTIVSIYTVLFRTAIVIKNQQLGDSMRQLQDTTQKLIQSEKMASLGVLSAGVAHEINNPLNFIKGGVEVMEIDLKKDLKNFDPDVYINVIKEGLDRAGTIVHSLSHYSRDTDSMDEVCDLHEILDNSVVMLQHKLNDKAEVIKEYTSDKMIIHGNEGKLHQAFINFIDNAENAIEQRGTITIKTISNAKSLVVEITDTGVGIERQNLNKISDPFYTTKQVGKGTGLGLSITYQIIEEHRGRIAVRSKVGKGTTFKISFTKS